MAFDVQGFLAKLLAGLGAPADILGPKILAFIVELKAQAPELATQIAKLEQFLQVELAPYIEVAQLKATVYGIAHDIMSGITGTDPGAWSGSV